MTTLPAPPADRSRTPADPVRRTAPCMGSMASVHVHDDTDPLVVVAAIDEVLDELERLEDLFSTFRPHSAISRVNRGELHLLDAPSEVLEVVDACTWLEHVSGGAFTAHPPEDPGRLDPAGFVKGWAVERASRRLLRAGLEHWYVGVGGDIQTHGEPEPGHQWRVAIADPVHTGEIVAVAEVGGAIATSGTAERGRHLWDGRSGRRVGAELASMTVLGPHLRWADAMATAAFAMGLDGLDWVAGFTDHHAIAVSVDGDLVTSWA